MTAIDPVARQRLIDQVTAITANETPDTIIARMSKIAPTPWGVGITKDGEGTDCYYIGSDQNGETIAILTGDTTDDDTALIAVYLNAMAIIVKSSVERRLQAELGLVENTRKFTEIRDVVAHHRDAAMAEIVDRCLEDVNSPLAVDVLDLVAKASQDIPTVIAQIAVIAARKEQDSED